MEAQVYHKFKEHLETEKGEKYFKDIIRMLNETGLGDKLTLLPRPGDELVSSTGFKFINHSGLDFIDISSEKEREYEFKDGDRLIIEEPQFLHVNSQSKSHRIVTANQSHYIMVDDLRRISWIPREGQPHSVK